MTSGNNTEKESAGPPDNTFSAALRHAISASGLSLDRIQARLQARGVSVSVTALSYWQSGKRQPERLNSISAVRVLEEILEVPIGTLLSLLDRPRPRGSSSRKPTAEAGDPMAFRREVLQPLLSRIGAPYALEQRIQLFLVGLHDRCEIAADGGQRGVTTRVVFQAGADGHDRWILVYDHGEQGTNAPRLHGLRNCALGRAENDTEHGVTVAELLFDEPINRGETYLIEYSLRHAGPPFPESQNTHYREFRRGVREYLLEVSFAAAATPRKCSQYSQKSPTEQVERRELKLDNSNSVHAVALDFGPGVFGIDWS